jgi:GNAT superfamily N-acetyltransferase
MRTTEVQLQNDPKKGVPVRTAYCPAPRTNSDAATDVRIRGLRKGELWTVLAIGRRAFPVDPWTTDTARGSLARLTGGGRARLAGWLARFLRLARLSEAVNLIRLTAVVVFGWPASSCCFVAEADTTVIGYASLNAASAGIGGVQVMAVRPGHEGTGIGEALLAQLIATAIARGYQAVCLYARADNMRARTFYARNGFAETGTRAGYYQPSGTDAIVMRLELAGRRPR